MHKVMIEPSSYDRCRAAVDRAFDLFPVDVRGKRVLVKPNVLRGATPEEAVTTHPAVLRAVVDKLEEMGPAALVVGDNPGIFNYGANEACFEKTGLMEAAKGYYQNIGDDAVKVDFNSEFMERVGVSREVLEADVVVSLPKFKTHGLTVMTGAIKNSYGILPGAQKAVLHRLAGGPERFHEVIVDVFGLRPPDLFIVDAVVGMEGNGPASPDLRDIGLILAADNAVAMDAVIARMMGLDPAKLGFMQKAKAMALGDFDETAIEIIGELSPIPDFKIPPLGGEASTGNKKLREFLHSRTLLRPKADPELCTACESCVDQCPVSALSMEENLPVVDADTCITCFCCQEVCPEKAITLQ
ncbi:MAG: DUF362 domain-containing protein [Deltaproteobacteria bacterium]|nr:DUF362 domain-containing protein [Deltaproteobacteria bacterium]